MMPMATAGPGVAGFLGRLAVRLEQTAGVATEQGAEKSALLRFLTFNVLSREQAAGERRERGLAAATEVLYPEPQRAGGQMWQHFRGPDGNVYDIIGPESRRHTPRTPGSPPPESLTRM